MPYQNILKRVMGHVATALIGLVLFQSAAFAATDKIKWQSYSKSIFTESMKDRKPILLFVKADWCPHCTTMKKTTLQNQGVIKLVNESYIPVMIDVDKNRDLAKKYKVTGLPAFIVLSAKDKKVADFSGEMTIIQFMQKLSQAYRTFAI